MLNLPNIRRKKMNIGDTFARWTVVDFSENTKKVLCKCSCGKEKEVFKQALTRGTSKSCGCLQRELFSKRRSVLDDFFQKGMKFNRWEVLEKYDKQDKSVLCKCECGTVKKIDAQNLKRNLTKSCGCYKEEQANNKDNHKWKGYSRIESIFNNMKSRCYNPNVPKYKSYGERGIKICDEWLNDSSTFLEWAINNGYEEHLTIERIDVNKGYSPKNCRWANGLEQANNKQKTVRININGIEMTFREIHEKYGVPIKILQNRYYQQGTNDERITRPVRKKENK